MILDQSNIKRNISCSPLLKKVKKKFVIKMGVYGICLSSNKDRDSDLDKYFKLPISLYVKNF